LIFQVLALLLGVSTLKLAGSPGISSSITPALMPDRIFYGVSKALRRRDISNAKELVGWELQDRV